MFFPGDNSIYQQLLDADTSSAHHNEQRQQQHKPQPHPHQPLFDYQMAQVGVFTPPTSPSAPAFQKYNGGLDGPDLGTLFYGVQPLTIQSSNAYVQQYAPLSVQSVSVQPTTLSLLQQQQRLQLQQQYQQQQAYQVLLRQFDNLDNSSVAFSPSLSSGSCNSSLSGSPNFSESPLMAAVASDFDLFPISRAPPPPQQKMMNTATTGGFPSAPVMAPSGGGGGGYHQHHHMTPPMNQMDLEREAVSSLFRNEFSQQHQQHSGPNDQTMTTELSQLCKCPGKFPCGDQLPDAPVELSPLSSLEDIAEDEVSESDSGSEDEEDEDEDRDPSYMMHAAGGVSSRKSYRASRPKSMTISTASGPYDSAYSRSPSVSSVSPVRQDRRRSSSGVYGSGSSLLEPEQIPEIKDIHVCPVCQRRFTRPFNLRSHLMTHTTARPFPCDECHWKFTRQHDLQRHRKAKHPQSYEASNPKKDATAVQTV
jgi:hypothetical protein